MGLWTLLEGCLLLANALAILNEDRSLDICKTIYWKMLVNNLLLYLQFVIIHFFIADAGTWE